VISGSFDDLSTGVDEWFEFDLPEAGTLVAQVTWTAVAEFGPAFLDLAIWDDGVLIVDDGFLLGVGPVCTDSNNKEACELPVTAGTLHIHCRPVGDLDVTGAYRLTVTLR